MPSSTISSRTNRPVQNVARHLGSQIQNGQLEPGQRLPSVRQLSKDMGVSPNTITAALGILETQRMVKRDQRRGVFVHQPSEHRRKLAVGLFTPKAMQFNTGDDWTSHITLSMFQYLNEQQIQPMVFNSIDRGPGWEQTRQTILENRDKLGGVILCWANNDDQKIKDFVDEFEIPIVQLGMAHRHSRHNFVSVDYFGAGRIAAEQVINLLPGPFITISEQCSHDFPRRQLIAGFQDRLLQERSQRVIFTSLDDASAKLTPLQLGRSLMSSYLADKLPIPRCVFGIGDLVAIGAMQVCMEHGLKVPEDVSFIGATGLDASHVCSPTLAHLRQPMDALGKAAVDMILEMYDQETCWLPGHVLPVQWGDGQSLAHR